MQNFRRVNDSQKTLDSRFATVGTAAKKIRVEHAMLENRRTTVNELMHDLSLSRGALSIMIMQLGFHKV